MRYAAAGMSEPKLTLYAESDWVSPWVFHVMVALEEKGLPYELSLVPLPIPEPRRVELRERAVIGKVPILVDGDAWITESLAISEYLAERYPAPGYPRLFPADLVQRARARQVMSALRTGFFKLREERPTSSVFGPAEREPAERRPLSPAAQADADELVRIASALIRPGATSLFEAWCIADADLALALMRLVANGDPVPPAVAAYTAAQWARPSTQKFLAHAAAPR
jgi:glutathione S-transferase